MIEALFKALGAWLVGIRERDRAMVEAAVHWASAHRGHVSAEQVAVLADVLTAGRGEAFDTNEAARLLDRGLLPAMIHLAAGAVASTVPETPTGCGPSTRTCESAVPQVRGWPGTGSRGACQGRTLRSRARTH